MSAKTYVNLNHLKQSDISEWFANTTLEKLGDLDLNSTNSVINDCLISSINSATEENITNARKNKILPAMAWWYYINPLMPTNRH